MKMSGTRLLDAPRGEVWEKLNDPDVLKRCIPGCESLEKLSDTPLQHQARHPRRQQPNTIVDHYLMLPEHDDHQLASITELIGLSST